MNFELNWLKYFYEVARLGSVTQASKSLRISQPAVTKMIRQLEQNSQLKLLEKRGRSVALTDEGRLLFQLCKKIFSDLEGIKEIQGAVSGELRDTLRIGASDHLCYHVLPYLVGEFSRKHPGVSWEFFSGVSAEIKSKLVAGELDVGIFYTKLNIKEQGLLRETKLGEVEFSIVVSKSWTIKNLKHRAVKLSDLKDATYIGARSTDYTGTLPEQWIYKRMGLEPEHSIQANSKEMQKKLVAQGLGYAVLPTLMIRDELKRDSFVQVKTPQRLHFDVLWVENKMSKSRRALTEFQTKIVKPYFSAS